MVIAEQEDIPKHFLSKILQQMVEAKILTSLKGPGGGFLFARDPKEVSLYDVINVYDSLEQNMGDCAIGWNECSGENPCDLHDSFSDLRDHVKEYFVTVNLETFSKVSEKKQCSVNTQKLKKNC